MTNDELKLIVGVASNPKKQVDWQITEKGTSIRIGYMSITVAISGNEIMDMISELLILREKDGENDNK